MKLGIITVLLLAVLVLSGWFWIALLRSEIPDKEVGQNRYEVPCEKFKQIVELYAICQETVRFAEDNFPGTAIAVETLKREQPEFQLPPAPEETFWKITIVLSRPIAHKGAEFSGEIQIVANKFQNFALPYPTKERENL
ncbi:MAG: hypothetical protein A2940_02120 [Candidatus Wildermuthbacteria bacterium RIFCSPLOWO2_01_FULL_48_29]|uniref:Uncharacterized protein n=2 Tax=Candidatus Wildermuthiibacteriota TaxID=1817923 RepID=A0A1G2RMF0_9BACT|nr:MAG: hypothetical protein A2843_01465 [Candidatus Wildermuthbacteria bacterium RIFCSPHIGHO2_01_FULL_48_27b]OHA74006.1 MAG: hypothetical protein A2940_02120 [Candidatus Wildermuthbacteria bacterium RIFCSPLOWO2_01_FULL_48_29]